MSGNGISIVIVSYNSLELLRGCLESLKKIKVSHEIIIVDNASQDGSQGYLDALGKERQGIKVISLDRNLGFSKASNKGAWSSSKDTLLFLNPDTEIVSGDIAKPFRLCLEDGTGVLGVKTLNTDNSIQLSSRSFPTLARQLYESLFLHRVFPKNRLFGSYFRSYADHDILSTVDWVSGSFMMIKKELFRSMGGFDEDFFMFSEDTDLCYRLAKSSYKNYYYPGFTIKHHDSSIASRDPGLREAMLWSSRRKYFYKNHSRVHAVAISLLYFWGIINRIVVFAFPSIASAAVRKRFLGYFRAIRLYFLKGKEY